MTESVHPDRPVPEDRTRDIALPPLPDRPPPALPKEWAGLRAPTDAPTTKVPGRVPPPSPDALPATAPPATAPPAPAAPADAAPVDAAPADAGQEATAPPATAPPEPPPLSAISREDAVARIEARRLASQRTDEMQQPPVSTRRDRTLAFSSPEMSRRPVEPVAVGRTSRRWPWVVLTLLPILVIVGAAVAWMLLLDGA
ncbi:hypothetical protein [Blastococcus saxobsidens]|uniref:Uncharacterized protein n=1 Tax=Blastococcus saxobsidens TaxID=138336 RepID=A0A4Q7Y528_9ACTN|nr:hypothetical protein [Blastococcus saxobsidens]RZU31015.1 hypothetical protein BKA19_0654 [Blastococcus saxobsidens]